MTFARKKKPARSKADLCPICLMGGAHYGVGLCEPCGKAYDRWNQKPGADVCTTIALIAWVSRRARRFEKQRQEAILRGRLSARQTGDRHPSYRKD